MASSVAKWEIPMQLSHEARETLTARAPNSRFPTLQGLTALCIWDNRHLFVCSKDNNLFDQISNPMRTYLLAAFSGSACPQVEIPNVEPEVNLYKLLTQLLHNEVVMFKFPPYFSTLSLPNEFELYTPYHLLWKKLKNTCRGLVEITIRDLDPYQGCSLLDSLLMSMKNVQVIELSKWYFMDDSRLCTLAEQLPNLRVLDVGLDLMKVSFKGFKALSNLQHLAEFIFYFPLPENKRQDRYDQILDHNIKNYKASMYYMPKLRVVGERMIRDTRQELDHVQVFVYCNEEALRNLRIPSTLGLQELIVSTPPVAGIEFPNLTSLLLYHKGDPWQSHEPLCCSSLVSLTELIIFNQRDLNISFYKKILNQVAVQLKSLWLYLGSAEVDEVLRLCPNLTHFHADGILKLASTVTPHTLRNLHVLELRFDERVDVNPELLLQLLQAPKLRELLLVCKFPSLPEHVPIVNMLEEHTILQKLEQVVLVETQQYAPGVANYSTCVMEAMISCCPNLVDVSYKLRTKNYL